MAKHGGSIGAESTPGAGAVFTLLLPLAESAPVPRGSKRARPAPTLAGAKILIMDDDAAIVRLMGRVLKRLGCRAEAAADGDAALAAWRRARKSSKPFDAVILDLTIPGGMGGKETAARLKALDPGVKIVISSGYADDPIMSDAAFPWVLAKPFRFQELAAILQAAVDSNENSLLRRRSAEKRDIV